MTSRDEIEANRTAIAILRARIDNDREAGLALMAGTPFELKGEVMTALLDLAEGLLRVLAQQTNTTPELLLEKLAIRAALDEE